MSTSTVSVPSLEALEAGGRIGALYLRKSRADEEKERDGKFETLAKHEADLRDLSKRLKLPINKVFRELESGESIASRKEFQALMEGVGQRQYAYVYCHAIDRLGRGDMFEYGWVISTFQYSDTKIITPGKIYDPRDPFDLQQLQLQMFFSNAEYMRIIARFKAGRRASARQGQYIPSRAPFGYDKVEIDKMKTLVPNKDAVYVREMYERIADGEAVTAISRDFLRRGIMSTRGKALEHDRIRAIIKNPVYKGIIRYGYMVTEVQSRDGMAVKKGYVKGEDPVIVQGLHEPLVSAELWQKANDNLHKSPPQKTGTTLHNPLAGMLVCSKCGRAMVLNNCQRKGRWFYTYVRHRPYTTCDNNYHSKHLEDLVDGVVDALLSLAGEYEIRMESADDGIHEHEMRLESMKSALASAQTRLSKLVDLYINDEFDMEIYRAKKKPLEDQIAELIEAIAEEELFVPKSPKAIAASLRHAIELLLNDELSAQEKNDALRLIIDRIEYDEDENGKPILDVYVKD